MSFGPSLGGETQKTRPAIIPGNDTANALINRVQVVPVSSQIGRLYPAEATITLNGARRKAMGDQITTLSKERLLRRLGILSADDLASVCRQFAFNWASNGRLDFTRSQCGVGLW